TPRPKMSTTPIRSPVPGAVSRDAGVIASTWRRGVGAAVGWCVAVVVAAMRFGPWSGATWTCWVADALPAVEAMPSFVGELTGPGCAAAVDGCGGLGAVEAGVGVAVGVGAVEVLVPPSTVVTTSVVVVTTLVVV